MHSGLENYNCVRGAHASGRLLACSKNNVLFVSFLIIQLLLLSLVKEEAGVRTEGWLGNQLGR